jgi:hypothetical protein
MLWLLTALERRTADLTCHVMHTDWLSRTMVANTPVEWRSLAAVTPFRRGGDCRW